MLDVDGQMQARGGAVALLKADSVPRGELEGERQQQSAGARDRHRPTIGYWTCTLSFEFDQPWGERERRASGTSTSTEQSRLSVPVFMIIAPC